MVQLCCCLPFRPRGRMPVITILGYIAVPWLLGANGIYFCWNNEDYPHVTRQARRPRFCRLL